MKQYIVTIVPSPVVEEKLYRIVAGNKTHLIKAKNFEHAQLRYEILKDERKLR